MSVLGSARLLTEEYDSRAAPTSAMDMEDDTEWVNDVYSQLNGTPARNVSTRWQLLNKYRLFIAVFSLLLVSLGVALLVPRSNCVSSLLPSMGTDCASVTTLSYFTAGLLCATGFLGCLGSCKGKRLTWSWCLAVLFFCYALFCGAFACFVVYSRLHQLDNLEAAWRRLVAAQPSVVCDVQKTLQCSGFAEGQCCASAPWEENAAARAAGLTAAPAACFYQAVNGSTYDLRDRGEVTWPGTMCPSNCAEWNAKTTVTCAALLKSVVADYFFRFVFILSALTFLFGAVGCAAIAGAFWKPSIDNRMEHRF